MRFVALSGLMLLAGLFVSSAQQPAASNSPSWESLDDFLAQSQPEPASVASTERLSITSPQVNQSGGSGGCTGNALARAVTTYTMYQPVYYAESSGSGASVQFVANRQPIRNTVRAGVGIVRRVASLPVRVIQNSRARRAARWGYSQSQFDQPQYRYVESVPQVQQYSQPVEVQSVQPVEAQRKITIPQPEYLTSVQPPAIRQQAVQVPQSNCPNGICKLPRKDCR